MSPATTLPLLAKAKIKRRSTGGFEVIAKLNVKFEELTITNQCGSGLPLTESETNVDVLKCAVKECRFDGMRVYGGATVTTTDSEFMENSGSVGVYCDGANTKTMLNDCKMHNNGEYGLLAYKNGHPF